VEPYSSYNTPSPASTHFNVSPLPWSFPWPATPGATVPFCLSMGAQRPPFAESPPCFWVVLAGRVVPAWAVLWQLLLEVPCTVVKQCCPHPALPAPARAAVGEPYDITNPSRCCSETCHQKSDERTYCWGESCYRSMVTMREDSSVSGIVT